MSGYERNKVTRTFCELDPKKKPSHFWGDPSKTTLDFGTAGVDWYVDSYEKDPFYADVHQMVIGRTAWYRREHLKVWMIDTPSVGWGNCSGNMELESTMTFRAALYQRGESHSLVGGKLVGGTGPKSAYFDWNFKFETDIRGNLIPGSSVPF
jgi:hypothetical protein